MEKFAFVALLIVLASRHSFCDVCRDIANRVEGEYTMEQVNACHECEWHKVEKDTRHSYYPATAPFTSPDESRLGNPDTAWCASDDGGDYLEIQLSGPTKVGGLVTQGYGIVDSWVSYFEVSYKNGSEDFSYINDEEGNTKLFKGNDDARGEIERRFPIPVLASAIRIHPIRSHLSACMKVDVYACEKMMPMKPQSMPSVMRGAFGWFNGFRCTVYGAKDCKDVHCATKFKQDIYGCDICECEEENEETKDKELFESDIQLTPMTRAALEDSLGVGGHKEGLYRGASSKVSKWLDYKQNGKILIPYSFGAGLSSRARPAINAAATHLASRTCIQLVQRTNQPYYINFVSRGGCSSPVGKQYGGNQVSIGYGCEQTGIVVHEILHSLGFWHEQSRPDRDRHVRILWQNIQSRMSYNFQKRQSNEVHSFGSPYDLRSLMHYGGNAFSKNGQPTIVTVNGGRVTAQRGGLSAEDIKQVNKMYNCQGTGTGTGGSTTSPATTKKPTTVAPGNCVDENAHCSFWAGIGECNKNPGYMKSKCKKSCRVCGGGGVCRDLNKSCTFWKRYCTSTIYAAYMKDNCPLTCEKC